KASKSLFGLKIFASRDLPYRTQVTPMAAILAVLGDKADTDNVRAKLAQWYWCGVFGELYGSAVETQFAKDVPEFLAWLDGGPEPTAIAEANFSRERLLTLKTRNSAAYKGLYALLLKEGGLDLRSGETINQQSYFDEKIDIHHIFPQKWCRTSAVCSRIAYSDQKRPWCSYLLPAGEGAPQGRMRAELLALARKSPHPAVPATFSPQEKERRPRRACNSTVKRANLFPPLAKGGG